MSTRLIHGDCLDALRDVEPESIDAVITDPPYGMGFQSNRVPDERKKRRIVGDEHPFIWFLPEAFRILKDGSGIVCFTDWKNQETWRIALECAGFTVRSHCIWDREAHGMGDLKAGFAPQHDVFWFATKGAFTFPNGRPRSIIRAKRPARDATPHPTAKPVSLMSELCRAVCPAGGTVCDPFMGSGSTGVAALRGGFGFLGVELDGAYFDFARQAMSVLTTDKPEPEDIFS